MSDYVASLAVDIDDSPLTRAVKALERLAELGEKVQRAFDKGSKVFNDTGSSAASAAASVEKLDKATDSAASSADKLEKSGKGASDSLNSIDQAAVRAADATNRLSNQALRSLGDAINQVSKAQDRFLFSLQDTVNTLGMTETELLRYKAAQLGVADAAEESIRKIDAFANASEQQRNALINQAKAAEAAEAQAQALGNALGVVSAKALAVEAAFDPLATKLRMVQNQMQEVEALYKGGAISSDLYKKAQVQLGDNLDKLTSRMKGVGSQAKLTAQEMLMLSAQVQDFGIQVMGGQNILMAFIQQASQASHVLGTSGVGVGAAFKQLGGAIVGLIAQFAPLILGFGAIAAAIGAVVFALMKMHDGAEEAIQITNTLAVVGKSAGITSKDFYDMADGISAATKRSAQSVRELQLEVLQSGKVTGENIGLVTETAIRMSKAFGIDAKNALNELLPLFDNTSSSAAKLNERYKTLTIAQWDQIQAFEAQGKSAEAAKVVLDSLSGTLQNQVSNMGILEQAWRGWGIAIDAVVEKLLKFGAVQTIQPRTQSGDVADAQKRLDEINPQISSMQTARDSGNMLVRGRGYLAKGGESGLQALQQEKASLEGYLKLVKDVNKERATNAQLTASIISIEANGKTGQRNKLLGERADIEKALTAGLIDRARATTLLAENQKKLDDLNKQPKHKKTETERWADRVEKQSDKVALQLANAQAELDQLISGGERGLKLAEKTGQLMEQNKDLYSAQKWGSDEAARAAAEAQAKKLIAIDDAAIRVAIDRNEKLIAESEQRLVNAMTNGTVTNPVSGQTEKYNDVNEALIRQKRLEEDIKDIRSKGLEATVEDLAVAEKKWARMDQEYVKEQTRLAANEKKVQSLILKAAQSGVVQYGGGVTGKASSNFEAIRMQQIATDEYNAALAKGVILTGENLKNRVEEVRAAEKLKAHVDAIVSMERDRSAETMLRNAQYQLNDVFEQFYDELPRKSLDAFKNLFRNLQNVITETFYDAMAAAFKKALDPFAKALQEAISNSLDKVIGKIGEKGEEGTGLFGAVQKWVDKSFGQGTTSKVLAKAGEAIAGYSIGQAGVNALGLGGKTSAQQTNSQIGSAIGTAIGTAIGGPIGAVIGSFLGGAVGGLFGPSSTNAAASSLLDATGKSTSGVLGTKRTDATTSALNTAITALQAGYKAIGDLGGTMTTYVRNLEIGQRDQSRVDLSNGSTVFSAVGDSGAAANAGLIEVLRGTTFATQALNDIKNGMISAGASFDDTYVVLAQVDSILKSTQPALSQWQQQLQTLDDTFKPLIETTGQYSSAIVDAYNTAKGALKTAFDADISNQLLAANSNVAYQYSEMLKTQAQRVEDATKIGGDLNNVLALNAKETQNFIDSFADGYSSVQDMKKAFDELFASMQAAGKDTSALTDAFNQAVGGLRSDFDKDIASQLQNAVNPTLGSLLDLLNTQKERLANAKTLGANIAAVDRLNAVETANFFKNLSDEQKKSLGDYLGIIEDYTGKIAVVLSKLGDEMNARIDNLEASREALLEQASTLRSLAESIRSTREGIQDNYSGVTPLARIADLRTQFQSLAEAAIGGDTKAMESLPDVANKLIELSRSLYGTTATFGADYDKVTSLLQQAETAAVDQATTAEQQAEAMLKQVDLLTEIRDALNDSDPNLEFLALSSEKLTAETQDVKNLLAQYLALNAAQNGQTLSEEQLRQLALLQANGAQISANNIVSPTAANSNGVVTAGTASQASGNLSSTDYALAQIADINNAGYVQLDKRLANLEAAFRANSEYLKQVIGK